MNAKQYYTAICYADSAIECKNYDDFVLATNHEELVKCDKNIQGTLVYLAKNCSLSFNTNSYGSNVFDFDKNITIEIDLPNNTIIKICYYNFFNDQYDII